MPATKIKADESLLIESSRQEGVTYGLLKGGAPTGIARSACDSIGVDEKAVPGTFIAYLVYRKPDRPKSKTIYNLHRQSLLPAHASISHNKPKWGSIPSATFYGDDVKPEKEAYYSVVTKKYNYVFIEISAARGPSIYCRCKTQFFSLNFRVGQSPGKMRFASFRQLGMDQGRGRPVFANGFLGAFLGKGEWVRPR